MHRLLVIHNSDYPANTYSKYDNETDRFDYIFKLIFELKVKFMTVFIANITKGCS